MKNRITLLVLGAFVVLILSVVAIRKIIEKNDRRARLRKLHPMLVLTLAMSDLTKLHQAALDDDAAQTAKLLEQGWTVDRLVKGGLTPLHVASMCGSSDSAAVLIKHGADLNRQDDEGMTPLAFAAVGAKRKMLEFLLEEGAQAGRKNRIGRTPAEAAQKWRQEVTPAAFTQNETYNKEANACIEILKQAHGEVSGLQGWLRNHHLPLTGQANDKFTIVGIFS